MFVFIELSQSLKLTHYLLTNNKKIDNTYLKMTLQSELLLPLYSHVLSFLFYDHPPLLFSRKKTK